jgi:Lon protease-like protein
MRYVQGDRLGTRELAKVSGRSRSSIQRWMKEDSWIEKKSQFETEVKPLAQQKTIEKMVEKLSDQLSEIAIANYSALRLQRDYATMRFQIIAKDAQRILKLPPEEQLAAAETHTTNHTIDTLSKILARAIAGINETVGLKYHVDINAAIDKAVREGYLVIDPSEENMIDD